MKLLFGRTCSRQLKTPADGSSQGSSQWRQYSVTILVNSLTFVAGTTYGWPAPILPLLQSEKSPVGIPPISDDAASWLASIFCVSRIITLPFYMYAIERYGCKITSYLVAPPFLLAYVMLLFANSMSMLFWARFVIGISAGGIAILAPSYTIDIAEDRNKGKLNVIYAQTMNFGITFSYAMGYYTSYLVYHVCCIVLTVAFSVALLWLPESPLFLVTVGKTEEAREVLKWLRNDHDSEFEFERMKIRAQRVLEKRAQKVSLGQLADRKMLRGLFICLGLTINQQLSGQGPVVAYSVMIFQQAGSAIPPNITTILLGVIMIFGTHLSSLVIERYGRRFLLISSDAIIALCLFSVGTYFYFQNSGWSVDSVGWLPVVSMLLYNLVMGAGLGPLPFTIATELVHPDFRSFVQTANVMTLSASGFAITLTFVPLMNVLGQDGCFWFYAACCAVGTLCIYFTLPETKNRSLEDVLDQMGGDRFIHSVLHYKKENDAPARKTSITTELQKV